MDAAALSLYDRAAVIPGRSMTRSKKVFGRFAEEAHGCIITDTEGREYIDMLCALGAVSIGYTHNDDGPHGVYSLPHAYEVEAAEAVLQDVANWASWVRFVKTGSESTHAAFRIARALTKREDVIRCVGAYHGWHSWCDEEPGTMAIGSLPPTQGGWRLPAAVFVEPSRFDVVDVEWLKALRKWCDDNGALLVFDSMIYGGRWHIGGLSGWSGVQADLETFGKAYGNGAAVSFVVGTDRTKAFGELPSGTFSGEISGLAGLIRTLREYQTQPIIELMWARGRRLLEGMRAVIPEELGTPNGNPPCQRISWKDEAVSKDGWRNSSELAQKFTDGMLARGVIWHPTVALTMYAHTAQHIDTVIAAAKDVVDSW